MKPIRAWKSEVSEESESVKNWPGLGTEIQFGSFGSVSKIFQTFLLMAWLGGMSNREW